MSKLLIHFYRNSPINNQPDFGERVAKVGLGLLRLSFGKTVQVTYTEGQSHPSFKPLNRSVLTRIAAIIISILTLPASLLLAGIGCIGLNYSKSHPHLYSQYIAQVKAAKPAPNPRSDVPKNPVENPPAQPRSDVPKNPVKNPPAQPQADVPKNPVEDLPEPQPEAPSGTFSKKFERHDGLNFSTIWAKPQVNQTLDHIKKTMNLEQLLNVWLSHERQQPGKENITLLDAMSAHLAGGTCYGQAMNILSLVGSKKSEEITEEYLHKNMSWKSYVYYQILHTLDVFLANLGPTAFVNGMDVKATKRKTASLFPHHKKMGYSTPQWKLTKFDKELLVGEFSDFIKQHIRGNNPTADKRNYAVQVTLLGKDSGHAGIVYYSETQRRYFWYDPYRPDYGLFSSEGHKTFFRGLADKLMEYKAEKKFTDVKFIAYRL